MLANKALSAAPSAVPVYVEDVFSTYLYTGNSTTGGTQTITNNIDLSTKGGLVWIKGRSAASDHILTDTIRGAGSSATNNQAIASNLTSAEDLGGSSYDYLSSFSTTGFVVTQGGTTTATRGTNYNNVTYTSWTFRKQAKFFDVVTWTGTGVARTISHNLGSVPGCIIVKCTSDPTDWAVYHRSLTSATYGMQLNTTGAQFSAAGYWNSTTPTSTVFSVGTDNDVNGNGRTYVAYLFAHDAGGFGAAGSDNVITCGSFSGTGATVTLGYEPQWLLIKRSSSTGNWKLYDNMRGIPVNGSGQELIAEEAIAEALGDEIWPTSTGFYANIGTGDFIYIAIRRGPMKTPTSGTSVFSPVVYTSGSSPAFTAGFPPDLAIQLYKPGAAAAEGPVFASRLQGTVKLQSSSSAAEASEPDFVFYQNGFRAGSATSDYAAEMFRRAPGFFDVVCYKGTGSAGATTNHNLGVSPELVITRVRDFTGEDWIVTYRDGSSFNAGYLNSTAAFDGVGVGTSTDLSSFTSTTYVRNTSNRRVNSSSYNYVAYLFASLSGVSKVGSYTGNGSSVTVTTNFQPRFILVKRTDSTGDWIVSDSVRGLVAGNDPYSKLNTTDAEVTNEDWVDITSTSFTVNQTTNNANVNTGTYIYLAIA